MATVKSKILVSDKTALKKVELHNTKDGHSKYYYIYLHQVKDQFYLEKKWGRIGSPKGSENLTLLKVVTKTGALSEMGSLVKSKTDKGYVKIEVTNKGYVQAQEPVAPEKGINSRFANICSE